MLYRGPLGWLQRVARRVLASSRLVRSTTSSPIVHEAAIRAFEAAPVFDAKTVVFVGSSSIRLWSTLRFDMAPMHAVNRGFGGAHTAHVRFFANRIFRFDAPSAVPAAIVYYAGDNDIAAGVTTEEALREVRAFLDFVNGRAPVLLLSAKYSPLRAHLSLQLREFNTGLASEARRRPLVHFLDVATVLLKGDGEPDEACFVWDGLHLSEEGYARWTTVIKPVVEELALRQSVGTYPDER